MADGIPSALQDELQNLEDARRQMETTAPEPPAPESPSTPTEAAPSEPETPPVADATPQTAPVPQQGETEQAPQPADDWEQKFRLEEQKYRVINGKYVAETGRMRRDNKALQARVEALEAKRESLSPTKSETPAPQDAPLMADDVSDEEVKARVKANLIDDYGMDFWKQQLALQQSRRPAGPTEPNPAEERVRSIEQRLDDQQEESCRRELTILYPDWQRVKDSKEWQEQFMSDVEPLTRLTYQDLLNDALEQHDVIRTVELFRRFDSLHGSKGGPNRAAARQEVPKPASPGGSPAPAKALTFDQWSAEFEALASSGLSPMALEQRRQELHAAYARVTDKPGSERSAQGPFV